VPNSGIGIGPVRPEAKKWLDVSCLASVQGDPVPKGVYDFGSPNNWSHRVYLGFEFREPFFFPAPAPLQLTPLALSLACSLSLRCTHYHHTLRPPSTTSGHYNHHANEPLVLNLHFASLSLSRSLSLSLSRVSLSCAEADLKPLCCYSSNGVPRLSLRLGFPLPNPSPMESPKRLSYGWVSRKMGTWLHFSILMENPGWNAGFRANWLLWRLV